MSEDLLTIEDTDVSLAPRSEMITKQDLHGEVSRWEVTWCPERLDVDEGLLNFGQTIVAWAHVPPVSAVYDQFGCVELVDRTVQASGDYSMVAEPNQVRRIADLMPGCYHLRVL